MAYAAPEAFSSLEEVGSPSDVYSLGVTLFRMLTGTLPFATCAAPDLAAAHLRSAPPDPRRFNPLLPTRVVRLIRKMLAKQPSRRPRAAELVAWLADLEIDTLDERVVA
jgi:serine/threonine-protein kinase